MKASEQVVLIDDDRTWLDTLSEYLHDRGFDVSTAEGPRPGLELLEQNDVGVAVIDFQMPDMNGLELLRAIRDRWQHVVVLLLSSEEDPKLATQALTGGAHAFLSKNMPPRQLLRKLQQVLAAALLEAALWQLLNERRARYLPAPEEQETI